RLTKGDVLEAASGSPSIAGGPAPAPVAKSNQPQQTPSSPRGPGKQGDKNLVPMTTIRKRIAERLVEAKNTTAMLTTFNEIDMSKAMELRAKYKDKFKEKYGINLGFMGFFVKA